LFPAQLKASRKPAGPFALFVRDSYIKSGKKGGNFQAVARDCAKKWEKMDAETKGRYTKLHDAMATRYEKEVKKQRDGKKVNYAWKEEVWRGLAEGNLMKTPLVGRGSIASKRVPAVLPDVDSDSEQDYDTSDSEMEDSDESDYASDEGDVESEEDEE